MPRVRPLAQDTKKLEFQITVKSHMMREGIPNIEKLSARTGIPFSTLQAYMSDPKNMPYYRLRHLCKVLKFTDEEKAAII